MTSKIFDIHDFTVRANNKNKQDNKAQKEH